jgi:hypothetical protein
MLTFKQYLNECVNNTFESSLGNHSLPDNNLIQSDIRESNTPDTLNDKLNNESSNFDKDDVVQIKKYTTDSKGLNSFKHKRASGIIGKDQKHPEEDKMNKLISKNKLKDDVTVYTGLKESPRKKIKSNKGILEHPAYMSVSTSKGVAQGFAHGDESVAQSNPTYGYSHIAKVIIPAGTSYAHISGHSVRPEENEGVLKPARYHFNDKHEIDHANQMVTWEAEHRGEI